MCRNYHDHQWLRAFCVRHAANDQNHTPSGDEQTVRQPTPINFVDPGYHEAVTGLFTQIHALTRTSVYADYSDVFRSDYAVPTGPHQVQMSAGTRTGYTFNANGAIVARKAVTFPRATSAPGTTRTRIKGRGYFYKITAGYLSGYWLPELAPYSYMSGFLTDAKYAYTRPAVFHAGVTEAWKIDGATGRLSSPIWSTLGGGSTAHTDRIAVINGQSYAYIVDNIFAGRWVLSRPVTIR